MAKSDDLAPPNPRIGEAIDALMSKITGKGKGANEIPPDVAVKIINTAIAWEKVKHQIKDGPNGTFDPDGI
jgi:hypothetical protein